MNRKRTQTFIRIFSKEKEKNHLEFLKKKKKKNTTLQVCKVTVKNHKLVILTILVVLALVSSDLEKLFHSFRKIIESMALKLLVVVITVADDAIKKWLARLDDISKKSPRVTTALPTAITVLSELCPLSLGNGDNFTRLRS